MTTMCQRTISKRVSGTPTLWGSVLLALWLALPAVAQKTVVIRLPGARDRVTFDPGRISEPDLRGWLQLSPHVSSANYYRVPETIDTCLKNDPGYQRCDEGASSATMLQNAEYNLSKIRRRIDSLDPAQYPVALSGVVSYFRKLQEYGEWERGQELKFLRTGAVSDLEGSFGGIDVRRDCPQALQSVREAKTPTGAYHVVQYRLANCINEFELKAIGPYPIDTWNGFLREYSVSEQYVEDDGD